MLVNTCSVTATADQGARQTIRRIARDNPAARIVVTGCYATRRPDEIAALPNVVRVVPNDDKPRLLPIIAADFGLTTAARFGHGDGACGCGDRTGSGRADQLHAARPDRMRASRARTASSRRRVAGREASPLRRDTRRSRSGRGRRIQRDRADRRPPRVVRPRPVARLVTRRTCCRALEGGSAPRTSCFASARSNRWIARARSSSLVADSRAFAPHFHLPLQHASNRHAGGDAPSLHDRVLRRRSSTDIRARMPHASIGSDVIVGFPGETDDDFDAARDVPRTLAVDARPRVSVFGSAGDGRDRR